MVTHGKIPTWGTLTPFPRVGGLVCCSCCLENQGCLGRFRESPED